MGFPPQALEIMRPWLAALTVSLTPLLQGRLRSRERRREAADHPGQGGGQADLAFETPEQQVRFFADMTPDQETQLLESTLDEIDEGPAKIDALVAAWASGDRPS
jgi:uncharacterized protein YbaP (TraB family)